MIYGKMILPDKLQQEQDDLYTAFFSQYADEDEIEDGAWEKFFEEHASWKLKRVIRKIHKELASLPAGLHV